MFEDRRLRRKRQYIILAIFLILSGAAFAVGYFMNIGSGDDVLTPDMQSKARFTIPDNLINPPAEEKTNEQANEGDDADTAANIDTSGVIDEDTVLSFTTYFTLCEHTIEKAVRPAEDEISMTELQIRAKYRDWNLLDFSSGLVKFERKIETHCPRHFIIGIDNGYIGIFVYNENGEKLLKERTDISVSLLTPEDQKSLESGIVADTEDDLQQKLEGFSE